MISINNQIKSFIIENAFIIVGAALVLSVAIVALETIRNTSQYIPDTTEKKNTTESGKNQASHSYLIREQERGTPPLSIMDTITFNPENSLTSAHPKFNLFTDDEILRKEKILEKKTISPSTRIDVAYTQHRKAIIQQQGMRGCTAAVAAMLIMDHGKSPNIYELQTRNLGRKEDIKRDFSEAKLRTVVNHPNTLDTLRKFLNQDGSAIVDVGGEGGNHVVIVDHIPENLSSVRLRDPYHGWEITVTAEAFQERWQPEEGIIQVNSQV